MANRYFTCDWQHEHPHEPVRIHYEVDAEGLVPRVIEEYADKRIVCRSVADFEGRENELPGNDSFVEGSFFDFRGIELGVPQVSDSDVVTLFESARPSFDELWKLNRRT